MLSSLRARLFLIVGAAALALLVMLIGSGLISAEQTRDVQVVEQRLVPKLELGPKLETEFEHLRQAMQDAAAAQDPQALDAALERRNRLFDIIADSHGVIEPNDAALLRWAVHDYYESAHDVSSRLIAGETGEALVDQMARMQVEQAKVSTLIKRTTGLDRETLSSSFATIERANERAFRFRLAIGFAGLVVVLSFSLSVSQSVLRNIRELSSGLSRFATGDFASSIPTSGLDELAKLAREANQMAADLQRLAEQRERDDWLKESQARLSDELRGDVEPAVLAERVVRFVALRTGAVAAALYLLEDGGLRLRGRYAIAAASEFIALDPLSQASTGEGLLVEATRAPGLFVVDEVPEGYLTIKSGLGDSAPSTLVFLPLTRSAETIGVLELALFKSCPPEVRELLISVREMLVVSLQAARSRAALREALERTQHQAERLAAQEEELRANNQELHSQHEELRVANAELEKQRLALSQQNGELEEARRRLQQKAEELGKMSTYKSQFLANMSHELRTPLNSMLLLSHLLAENETNTLSDKQVEYAKTIHSAGGDLLNLINQVLDLAKIEAGRQDLDLERTSVQRFADYAKRVFEPLANDKGLRLRIEVLPGVPEAIDTDPHRVERILTNLLGNAVKFTDSGEVALRIKPAAPGTKFARPELSAQAAIAFEVSDTGIGIAAEAHERVFAPFEQIESHSTRRYAGTGLGLAISRESAALLGGELQLTSRPKQGSTFTCFLPIHSPEQPTTSLRPVPSKPKVVDDRAQLTEGAPHLLVIEDDPVLAEQLVEIIHARRLKAIVANTGEEGMRWARLHKPEGVILDVTLPDIDGWTVMERLRTQPTTREIPVHFITGVNSPDRGFAMGAIGYLMKPATHSELALAVRSLTPGAEASGRRILVVEDSAIEGDSLCELLQRENFEAKRVGSAREALEILEKQPYECMILDLGLPDMDGLAVLETLRARGAVDAPRVIVHTGRALDKRETQQLEAYAEAVVLKQGNSAARLLEEIRLFVSHVHDALTPRARSQIPPPMSGKDAQFGGAKLLLAEDDMRTVYALSALLSSKGATVLVADTGKEALELLDKNPDLDGVLMDIMMPEMDGYQATRELRRDPRFQSLPVIALTAKAMKGERERCLEAGASDYLTKPIDTDKLLHTLQVWLPRGHHVSGK